MNSIEALQIELDRLYVQLELATIAFEKHQSESNEQRVVTLDKQIDDLIDKQLALEALQKIK